MASFRSAVLLAAVCSLVAGCRQEAQSDPRARFPIPVDGAAYDSADAELPRLQFPDGTRTENDRCMILKRKLNPGIPPTYVNGTPLGFC